jgi:assimilatory nitrate reductase catalytic subunit
LSRHDVAVCRLEDIVPDTGVCALLGGEQVAIFRLDDDRVHALANFDPFSRANVLSRGIVGDLQGEPVVASPVYKQHFSLASGRCVEDATVRVPVYAVRVLDGTIYVEPRREVATTCCYCGIGCGVLARVANGAIESVRGDPAHPANFGRLCTKGMTLHKADPSFRALYPEVDNERVSWGHALDFLAARLRETIQRLGPDAIGFYVSGQFLTEDYYVFNKLAKGLIGTNNIDTNSRLCMASAVAGYKQTLGADAPPACYEDVDAAECLFIAGSNTAWAHPVLFRRIEQARPRHLVVVDPRKTETARAATLHLQIAPGTDVALFNGMLHVILREGWCDERYVHRRTEGLEAVRAEVATWSPAAAAARCRISERDLLDAARLFAQSSATLSLYCQGLNQSASGTAKNAALINLHLATGQIGRPGAGPFSLTGQPNAMGGREVGGMANLLPAHRDLANPEHRREVAEFWGVSAVPAKPGKTAVEMFEAARTGEIKILWIACTNPAQSLPDQRLVHEALQRAELVVVQDAYRNTETGRYAHVFLPAAGWGEKEGTMTNSERRISRVRAALPPPGETRADWQIAVDVARRLGGEGLFPYRQPEEIFNEHRETTRGRDLDITGLSYALLDERGPQQWPFPEGAAEGKKRLYEDGAFPTASGRARFVPTPYRPVAEEVDADFPFRLTTGRLRDQWHSMSRTGTIAQLFSHEPEPRLTMHPDELPGELVKLCSRRGELYLPAVGDADLPPGTVFIPMHWGARFLGGKERLGVNELTIAALDPTSRQPELKHCAVRVEAAELPWRLVAFGTHSNLAELMERLEPFMTVASYASRTLMGHETPGVRLALAAAQPLADSLIAAIDAAFGEGVVRLSGDVRTTPRLKNLWQHGRTICNCYNVTEAQIATYRTLDELQTALKCGTNCGSCLPELRSRFGARHRISA